MAAVIMALIMAVSGGACLLLYLNTVNSVKYRMELHQNAALNVAVHRVYDSLQGVISDLKFLGSHHEILSQLVQGNATASARLTHQFLNFARHKGDYDQVRLLNGQGREVVRVNYNNGRPVAVAADRLQDKSGRYYFTEAATARSGEVYVSAFDLNMETGRVETPLKPMIRFSQPIFSDGDRFLGVLVLNYLGKLVLERIRDEDRLADGDLMLVNSDGFWLFNPNPELEWGFMLPERSTHRFGRDFSKEWRTIAAGDEGRISSPNGLFAYKAFYPGCRIADSRNCGAKVSARSRKWIFVHRISREVLRQRLSGQRRNLFLLWAGMAFFSLVPAWLLSSAFLRRRQTQYEIWRMANFDALTGLFNRSSFMLELRQTIVAGERYRHNFVLLYLDLDGFKQINDTLGHAAGDQVLQETARRFQAALRVSDCVARLGGDEFCIIVRETGSVDEAARVADKLIDVLASPFDLGGRTGRVGTSIGIACFPEDDGTAYGLLKLADQAMYVAKAKGKNRYCFAMPD